MLWFGLVSRVGALHRVNLIAPFPLGQNCPRKITMTMTTFHVYCFVAQLYLSTSLRFSEITFLFRYLSRALLS